ncbi:hypothetical protein [Gorillibacterium sp. CAU 1737]
MYGIYYKRKMLRSYESKEQAENKLGELSRLFTGLRVREVRG